MSHKTMCLAFVAAVLGLSPAAMARHEGCTGGCATAAGCGNAACGAADGCVTCPQCHATCELKVEEGKEERSCWKIEKKQICIPFVVFPWQKDCCDPSVNNGACVRTIKVLTSHKYECPTCNYSWTPKETCCTPGGNCGCGDCGCTAPGSAGCTSGCVASQMSQAAGNALVAGQTARDRAPAASRRVRSAEPASTLPRQEAKPTEQPKKLRFANYLTLPSLKHLVK